MVLLYNYWTPQHTTGHLLNCKTVNSKVYYDVCNINIYLPYNGQGYSLCSYSSSQKEDNSYHPAMMTLVIHLVQWQSLQCSQSTFQKMNY